MTYELEKARRIDDLLEEGEIEEDATAYAFEALVSNIGEFDFGRDAGPVEKTFAALQRIESLEERVDELKHENESIQETVDRLGDIGSNKTSKEQKIAAVVTYADQARETDQSRITVTRKNVKGAAGVSRRYAYDLVDDMIDGDGENGTVGPDGFDWALDPAAQSRAIDQDAPTKGVLIDFDVLHDDPAAVNKFITGSAAVGVAD
ncbi:hypothetical protein Hbl1158_10060 [Halobaculum sp. CBA1158]|uniref:hypothetical protein n=1 Tax=Halobaculum sp. CBA1158 TaxID=2904243 RepID=UPI001F18D046|nr:hypothetical protein [Halobaculum sp. CBA1158]UIO98877.1 hypothetical protein Hbl1158_10060 [Halobaculum sp. CBA1158]